MAAIAGIVTNAPLFYAGVKTADLEMAVKSLWGDIPTDAERRITATNVKLLATAKKRNTFKGFVLVGAISFQLVAVAALALAVRVVMSSLAQEPTGASA